MNGFWIDVIGEYYEGDQQVATDVAVDRRPDPTFILKNNKWVINPVKAEEMVARAVQEFLDAGAIKFGYADCLSACSYVTDPVALWANQATAFVHWRSAVWTKVYADLASVQAGTFALPASIADYLATLPVPVIPAS